MGPRSKDTIPPPTSISSEMDRTEDQMLDQSGSNALTVEDGPETTNVTEAWAVAEGYTPLNDLNNNVGDSYIMVSTGPTDSSDSDDENEGGNMQSTRQGNFYVNPNVFGNMLQGMDVGAQTASQIASQNLGDCDFDFDAIAANALSALDEEYQQTIVTSDTDSNEKEVDEDLKIIAAGFDARKEELKQIQEQGGFQVDWDHVQNVQDGHVQENSARQRKIDNNVDTDAVRRAIETLSVKNKDAAFQQKFAAWQQNQQRKQQQENNDPHALIPAASYKIFHETKPTAKSRQASANLSRSATLAEAVVRLSLLNSLQDDSLLIDIVGVDHVECESDSTIQNTFRPFARWLGDYFLASQGNQKVRLHFRLIGRELFTNSTAKNAVVDILDSSSTTSSYLQATATCHSGVYHEFLEESVRANADDNGLGNKRFPDLAVAFNAGIWGYREWAETIQYMALQHYATTTIPDEKIQVKNKSARSGLPMIITAYTLDECQEDQEVIAESISPVEEGTTAGDSYRAEILWASEKNPFGSQVVRETKGSTQEYRENACWQAWLLGGK